MKLAHSVRLGAWLLIGLNLLMALGSIWVFMRMAPAIEVIIDRNTRSLQACEEMLAALVVLGAEGWQDQARQDDFRQALHKAEKNITEKDEPEALAAINQGFAEASQGDALALPRTVAAITSLGRINREAMTRADRQARQFGSAGAWGVVFMAVSVFFAGILFLRSIRRHLIIPLEEIHAVVTAHRNGETMRRCTGAHTARDIQTIFEGVNDFLDQNPGER